MRFNVDLLPQEYKSFRRPTAVFAFGMFVVAFSAAAIFSMMVSNTKILSELDQSRKKKVAEIDGLVGEQNKIVSEFPVARANLLRERIQFINSNLNTPGTSWIAFLSAFEQAVPERVWIQGLDDGGGDVWKVRGEAGSVLDLMEFIRRLQESPRFDRVFPLQHSTLHRDKTLVTTFSLTFHFKGGAE